MSEKEQGIQIKELPKLNDPILIAGFDGWGNALVSAKIISKVTDQEINPAVLIEEKK